MQSFDDAGCGTEPVAVVFCVDTEPDNQWENHRARSLHNIEALPRFDDLMRDLDMRPTYLVTQTVADDPRACDILRGLQCRGAEIGAHLHVWESPPYLPGGDDHEFAAFGHDLPLTHFHAKLENLTAAIASGFGRPTSYRAGRFGFAAEHVDVLEQLGYRVDSSITPLIDRRAKAGIPRDRGGRGGRDYRRAPLDPYHPEYADDLLPGGAHLWEIPLTCGPRADVSRAMMALHRRGPHIVQRVLRKLRVSEIVSASPVHYSARDLGDMLETAASRGRRVLNLTLHSSETIAGGSPSIRDETALLALFDRIRQTVERLRQRFTLVGRTLSEVAAHLDAHEAMATRRTRV